MMDETEKLLSDVNQGTAAAATYQHVHFILDEVRTNALSRLKQMYRDGTHTEGKLLACTAELCTLDDIENRFKAKIRKGERAMGEINGR